MDEKVRAAGGKIELPAAAPHDIGSQAAVRH
jgi:hypothetical protein